MVVESKSCQRETEREGERNGGRDGERERREERKPAVQFDGYLLGCHQVYHKCISRWARDALCPGFGHVCVKIF